MRAYRAAWATLACLVGGIGCLLGLTNMHTAETAAVVGIGAVVSCVTYLIGEPSRSKWVEAGRVITAGLVGAGICLAITGLLTLLGPAAALMALLLTMASPPAVHWYGVGAHFLFTVLISPKLLHSTESCGEGTQPRRMPPVSVRSLTNQELCRAWRISYTALQRIQGTEDITHQAGLIALRQAYLDELERRDPHGFARWLSSGARPSSDPSRFINTAARPPDM